MGSGSAVLTDAWETQWSEDLMCGHLDTHMLHRPPSSVFFFSFRGVVDSLQINEWSLMFTTAFLFRNHLTMKYSVHHPDQSTNTSFEYCLILYLKTVLKLANRLLLIKIINCHQFGLLIHGSSVSKKLNVQQPHVRGRPPSVILW